MAFRALRLKTPEEDGPKTKKKKRRKPAVSLLPKLVKL